MDEVIIHVEQRIKIMEEFRFVELLKAKTFSGLWNKFLMKAFATLDVLKNILDLDGLKCKLKSVYATDFTKQASNIHKVTEII